MKEYFEYYRLLVKKVLLKHGIEVSVSEKRRAYFLSVVKTLEKKILKKKKLVHPKILEIKKKFNLDDVESEILTIVLVPYVFPELGLLIEKFGTGSENLNVGMILEAISSGNSLEIDGISYFFPESKLVKYGLIKVSYEDNFLKSDVIPYSGIVLWMGKRGGVAGDKEYFFENRLIFFSVGVEETVLEKEQKDYLLRFLRKRRDNFRILLTGKSGCGKTHLGLAIGRTLNRKVLKVDSGYVLNSGLDIKETVYSLMREVLFHDAILFFDDCEFVFYKRENGNTLFMSILELLQDFKAGVIFATSFPELIDDALFMRVDLSLNLDEFSSGCREQLWKQLFGENLIEISSEDVSYIAKKFEFNKGMIVKTFKTALILNENGEKFDATLIEKAARLELSQRLFEYAEKTVAKQKLKDLILPDEVFAQIKEIIEAIRVRQKVFDEWGFGDKFSTGKGLICLFDGESGTGKTLAAEIISNELKIPLYRVNVANILDKYVGETEKNLTRVFIEAKKSHSILLFDEADALFAKRVKVESAQDRFANVEINILLQLVERYEGIVILTTNLKKGIDKAFERRLNYKINFPFPDVALREKLWKTLIPEKAPLAGDVDFRILAKSFEFSGGSIKNAILRAAYLAASQGKKIDMDILIEAAKREAVASGKLYRIYSEDE